MSDISEFKASALYDPSSTVCFTGPLPRNLYGYDSGRYDNIREQLEDAVHSMYKNGQYELFITGGAQGIDQLAFWAVDKNIEIHDYPLKNILFIPFDGQDRFWRDTGLFSKNEYDAIKQKSTEIVYVSNSPDPNDKKAVGEAMLARNREMVDASNLIIGVYPNDKWMNGDRTDPGTAYTLKYALSRNKHIMVMNPDDMSWKSYP